MSGLRIVGILVGMFGLVLTFRVYRGPRWKKFNFIVFGLFSVAVFLVSINPNLLNRLVAIFALQQEERGRVIALLIASSIMLWLLLIYYKTKLDEHKYQFDKIVRYLGFERTRPLLAADPLGVEVVIIIPAYNECENLKSLLRQIPLEVLGRKVGVIVVDDGSTDATVEVVEKYGYLIARNAVRRGGGAALRLGYDIAKSLGVKIAVTIDGDGQHNPQEIHRLIEPILQDKYDLVIGSRILGSWKKDNKIRFVGLHLFNLIINLLTTTKITDCSSGFKAFKMSQMEQLELREDQFQSTEVIIEAAKKGLRIGEVPISITARKYGQSKKGKDWSYGLNFVKTIIKTWWR